jgi:hypothetical protein
LEFLDWTVLSSFPCLLTYQSSSNAGRQENTSLCSSFYFHNKICMLLL